VIAERLSILTVPLAPPLPASLPGLPISSKLYPVAPPVPPMD